MRTISIATCHSWIVRDFRRGGGEIETIPKLFKPNDLVTKFKRLWGARPMTITTPVLRVAAACLFLSTAPAIAGEIPTCGNTVSTPRLVCDEGACIRVPVKDLCDAVRAAYPGKRRALRPSRIELNPVRDELTLLIASVS
jgi:hypothetical protein